MEPLGTEAACWASPAPTQTPGAPLIRAQLWELGTTEAGAALGGGWGRGNSEDVEWLKLSSQQAGPEGMDVPVPGVPAERFCLTQLAGTGLLSMQHVALAVHSPALAPWAARHALAASLRLSLEKKMLAPACTASCCSFWLQQGPSICAPAHSAHWAALCGFSLSRLRSRQVCTNQDSVGLMFQERQGLIIFQAQKNPKHLWLRPTIARIQCPCPKPAAVAVPSLGGSSFLPSPSWLGQAVPAGT